MRNRKLGIRWVSPGGRATPVVTRAAVRGEKGGGVWCGFSSSPSVVWCGFSYALSTSKSATCGSTLGYLKLPGWCNVYYLLIPVIICIYDYDNYN